MPVSANTLYDADQSEVLSYHWHPMSNSPIVTPHLERGALVGRSEVREAHLSTGAIPLRAFLRLLIRDLSFEPNRPD